MNKKKNKKLIRKDLLHFAASLNKKIGGSNYDIRNKTEKKIEASCWVWFGKIIKVNITTGIYYVLLVELKEKLMKSVDSNSQ